jgi:NTP-dependent ternary system trypsin peptidase co-occuring protein
MGHGYLMEMPLDDGENRLVVEVDSREMPQELVPAARPGEIVERARTTLESALKEIQPGIRAVANWAHANAPDEFTVEFGLKLGGQAGVVVARGTAEVNFVVTLTWKK